MQACSRPHSACYMPASWKLLFDLKQDFAFWLTFHWGDIRPPDPPNKSASGLLGNIDFSLEVSHFRGGWRADLREAGGRLVGGSGVADAPQLKDS